jgi:hypothetical protein
MAGGAFAELEQAEGILVAGLIQARRMTIAILFYDAKVAETTLGQAGGVAITQLLEHGGIAIQPLKQGVEKKAISDSGVFFGVGALDSDGELTGKLGIGLGSAVHPGKRERGKGSDADDFKSFERERHGGVP